jgi:hypothetical protein
LHAALHAPQSVVVVMLRSQPLFGLPSQLAKPALQVGTQAPAVHVVEPWPLLHAVLHAPQFDELLLRFTSQPFALLASQLPNPELHESEHAPRLHVAVAFAPLHTAPHPPQFPRLVLVFVSQPLFGRPSQFAKLPVQTGVHTPATQLVVPFAFVQAMPHPPQLLTSPVVGVSQPFFGLPSQSEKPAEQVGTQVPPVHVVEPCALEQAMPHPPQLLMFVAKTASQPLTALPSQLPVPALHTGLHAPAEHDVVPFGFVQFVPQAPQLPVLVFVFVSQPFDTLASQFPKPALQAIEQEPSAQPAVPFVLLHTVPQPPQFVVLVCVFVSQPLVRLPSQFPKFVLQEEIAHALETHAGVALAKLHTFPHVPQLFTLFVRFVSQPFAPLPSQLPRPEPHDETPQTPATQFGVPPEGGQMLPQVLQLLTSVLVFVSQPLFALPSQFLNPALQVGTQAPAVQVVVPFGLLHVTPQAPQFEVVFSGVSQPLRVLPSQSPKPELQVGTHAPAVHTMEPFALEQPSPQPPQLPTLDCVFVSQPLLALLSQFPKPEVQVGTHVPLGHEVVPLAFVH